MAPARVKPQYGPSLAHLLAPRWRTASRAQRALVVLAALVLVAALLGAGLTLENARFSHGGPVPFGFEYRSLYRTRADPGDYVKIQSRYADGALKYSYAAGPLRLPAYAGDVQAVLPIYAGTLVRELARRYEGFALRGEGKAKVNNTLIGYQIAFAARIDGAATWGRLLLFTPPRPHPRAGVLVTMLSAPDASSAVLSPLEVGESGVLLRPLKTFSFG